MNIKTIKLKKLSQNIKSCPDDNLPEFAFVGRSNVGKSSLINFLTKSDLSGVSKTPGKTKMIMHFAINEYSKTACYLVDLPGYGFARVSKERKSEWGVTITEYILQRENLRKVFVLIDASIFVQDIDLKFITWIVSENIPFSIVFTKIDKVNPSEKLKNISEFKDLLSQNIVANFGEDKWSEISNELNYFEVSTVKNIGAFAILDSIEL